MTITIIIFFFTFLNIRCGTEYPYKIGEVDNNVLDMEIKLYVIAVCHHLVHSYILYFSAFYSISI